MKEKRNRLIEVEFDDSKDESNERRGRAKRQGDVLFEELLVLISTLRRRFVLV